jgi:hypothetical protein
MILRNITISLLVILFSINYYAQSTKYIGITPFGGEENRGLVFELDSNLNNHIPVVSFRKSDGKHPWHTKLVEASNGSLFGVTSAGGNFDQGIIYEFDPMANQFSKRFDFNNSRWTGTDPHGGLIEGLNGRLFGMTSGGGQFNRGTVYEYNYQTGQINFLEYLTNLSGDTPKGRLFKASDDRLYGMTKDNGFGNGSILKVTLSSRSVSRIHSFSSMSDGYGCDGNSLIEPFNNGLLYGMTTEGGQYGGGVVFEYNIYTSVYTVKHHFNDSLEGWRPQGSLILADNGKFYGLTTKGGLGIPGCRGGVIFSLDTNFNSNSYQTEVCFDNLVQYDATSNYGEGPVGDLIQATNGKLYGITSSGGISHGGVIFEYNINTQSYIQLHNFLRLSGSDPLGSIMQHSNGKLYGATWLGGRFNKGVLFEYDIGSAQYTVKFHLGDIVQGENPFGSLIQVSNGKFYGLASSSIDNGSIFEFDQTENSIRYSFHLSDELTHGKKPTGSLLEPYNKKIYGLTSEGGDSQKGILFEFNPTTNSFAKKQISVKMELVLIHMEA